MCFALPALGSSDAPASTISAELHLENLRIVPPDSAQGIQFESYAKEIFLRIYPGHDFQKMPVRFYLSDDPQANALTIPTLRPRTIVFTTGFLTFLLKHLPYADAFAAVLGHEWAHNQIEMKLGGGANSKAEEFIADLSPLECIHLAGFDVRQALALESAMGRELPKAPLLLALLDVHGLQPNREKGFKNTIAYLDRKYGGLRNDPTALPGFMADLVQTAKHTSVLDAKMRESAELRAIEELVGELNPNQTARAQDIAARLNVMHVDGRNAADMQALERIADLILSIIEANSVKGTSDPFGSQIYAKLSGVYKRSRNISMLGRWPMGRLNRINDAAMAFVAAQTHAEATIAARELHSAVEHETLPISFLQTILWHNFPIPDEREFRANRARSSVSWNRFLAWASHDPTGEISGALMTLGIVDERLELWMPVKLVIGLLKGSFQQISLGPVNGSVSMLDLRLSSDGRIVALNNRSGVERDLPRRYQTLATRQLAKLFEQAMNGDLNAERDVREVMATSGVSEQAPGIFGLEFLERNFQLFADFNFMNGWGMDDHLSADSRHRNLFREGIAQLVAKLSALLKSDFKKYKDPIRNLFFAGKGQKFSHLNDVLMWERSVYAGSEYLNIILYDFVLNDPFEIFSAAERLALIEEHSLAYPDPNDNGKSATKRSEILPRIRRSLAYPKPASLSDLRLLAERPGMAKSSIITAEFMHFMDNATLGRLDFGSLLPFIDIKYLRLDQAGKERLISFVEQMAWPEGLEDLIQTFNAVQGLELFHRNQKAYVRGLGLILGKIAKENPVGKRIELLETLFAGGRITDPALREKAFSLWIKAIVKAYGKDHAEARYRDAIREVIERNKARLQGMDRIELFSGLAKVLEAQAELSREFENALIDQTRKNLVSTHSKFVLGEGLLQITLRRPHFRKPTIEFLTSALTNASIANYVDFMADDVELRYDMKIFLQMSEEEQHNNVNLLRDGKIIAKYVKAAMPVIHENFWAAPFPARTVILDEILFPENHSDGPAFEEVLQYVLNRSFPEGQKYSAEARKIIRRYLSLVPHYQKSLLVSAMLVSNIQEKVSVNSIGERLAGLFELMGPAETKFGQAMHSHPDTPDELREGVKRLKSLVDEPFRWDLLKLYESRVPADLRSRITHVGKILGAASYYIVFETEYQNSSGVNEPLVIALLRENAVARAKNGFALLSSLAQDLERSGELSATFREMVQEAQKMTEVETSSEIAASQYEIAARRYNGMRVRVGQRVIQFKAAELVSWGEGYRVMKKAPGLHFNDLPQNTPDALAYKVDLARAYVALEIYLLLEGLEFDHDRHGAQLRVSGDTATLFDFGAMSLDPPTPEERQVLGEILGEMLNHNAQTNIGLDFFSRLQRISHIAKRTHKYLVWVERAVLALNDFIRYIPAQELPQILQSVIAKGDVHPEITMGFLSTAASLDALPSLLAPCEGELLVEIERAR